MSTREQMLVIVDPANNDQSALERAVISASLSASDEKPHLVLLVTAMAATDEKSAKNSSDFRSLSWFNGLQTLVEEKGLTCDIIVSWDNDWANTVLAAISEQQPSVVLLPFYGKENGGNLLSDDKWQLLRNCEVPVLLVRPGSDKLRTSILASLKIQDDSYTDLNQRVLERGAWAAKRYNADLHVVNAYNDSMSYPDRNKLASLTNIDNSNIHLQQGDSDEAIAAVAQKVDADIIVIGTKRRSGLKAALRGNTIEKIINKNAAPDIMMMV